jgi:opacity protein-like surface antigen
MRFKKIKSIILSALLVALILAPAHALAATGNPPVKATVQFNIQFKGSNYDPDSDVSTWYYRVSGTEKGPDLSHWVLGLCPDIQVIKASHKYKLETKKPDPTTGLTGIKFDQSVKVDQAVNYWIMVKGNWTEGQITSAVKGGPGFITQTVEGPTCKMIEENTHINSHTKTIVFLSPKISVKSSSTNLIIHVKIKNSTKIKGKWHFNLGGKMYFVEGDEEMMYTVEDAPVGTYSLNAKFVSNDRKQVIESEPIVITVATETGGTLPKTSTPWYNLAFVGSILSSLGLALFRRLSKVDE